MTPGVTAAGVNGPPAAKPATAIVRRFGVALTAAVLLGASLRLVFPAADPPWHATAGIVWHDEGGWAHNARNKALFGAWRQDDYNPMFVSPVVTALEFVAFEAGGVGVRQARAVSEFAGILSVLLLGLAMKRVYGPATGIIAALLMATNYIWVMYTRVALLEAVMVTLVVSAFYTYCRADRSAGWSAVSGVLAIAALFAKASALFFLVSLGLCALMDVALDGPDGRRRGVFVLAGMALAGLVAGVAFVLPNWQEYVFYNVQLYGARRSSLGLRAIIDRASWFPIIHDFFTRMWLVVILAVGAAVTLASRVRRLGPAERLLLLWIVIGSLELIFHDLGNERRFVFLVPAIVALAAITLGTERRLVGDEVARIPRRVAWLSSPLLCFLVYVVAGAVVRLGALYQVRFGVRVSAAVAVLLAGAVLLTWPAVPRLLSRTRWTTAAVAALVGLAMAADLAQFGVWARHLTYRNYEASLEVGRLLPPGTPVLGKLSNGLALENRIRPLYLGPGFGNYADRRTRTDVKYVLTYVAPKIGYEGEVIKDVLDAHPGWRVVAEFPVAETPGGADRAALIDLSR